jgi:hypothetical protein
MSLKADIMQAIATRLETITTSNAYSLTLQKVYYDQIPMGIQLLSHNLPAMFLLDGDDRLRTENGCLVGEWDFRIQLWYDAKKTDFDMMNFVRDVYKCIYANSPNAERQDGFRALHPSLVEFKPVAISPDLNMIEANRIYELSFLVHYRTKLYSL